MSSYGLYLGLASQLKGVFGEPMFAHGRSSCIEPQADDDEEWLEDGSLCPGKHKCHSHALSPCEQWMAAVTMAELSNG